MATDRGAEAPGLTESRPALWPYLLACAAAAAWADFGTIHRDQHSDSLVQVLISLDCWTPFMWELDRIGMITPLLASPIRNPLANLLFQAFVMTTAGLASFFLLARYAVRDASYPAVGALGAAGYLALTPHGYRFDYLVDAGYLGVSLDLGLGALILLGTDRPSRWRWLGALGLVALAHWVNCATALMLGPLVVFRGVLAPRAWDLRAYLPAARNPDARPREPEGSFATRPLPIREGLVGLARFFQRFETARALLMLGVGYEIGQALMGLATYHPTTLAALTMAEWPATWRGLLDRTWRELSPQLWPAAMAVEAAVGVVGLVLLGRGRARVAAAPLATGAALALLMGTRLWVKLNAYDVRFLLPALLMAQTGVAALAVPASFRVLRAWGPIAAAALLVVAAAWSYGLPSPTGVRREIDRRCGTLTDDLLASGSTHLAGDYWTVWASVFHADLALHERGEARRIWGVTEKAGPTYQLWKASPMTDRLVAIPIGDGLGEHMAQSFQFPPLREVETRPTIRVFRPVPRRRDDAPAP